MKQFLTGFFALYSLLLFANIAQPGMWQAGGMGNFSLLFPEDSTAYRQIRMEREQVNILLYPGFAVVKGSYWMRNEGDSTLTIRTGYPINSQFASRESRKLTQVMFEDLYALKVLINGEVVENQTSSFDGNDNVPYWAEGNWYVWNNTFPKDSLTRVDVYFIVNTNNASVLQGYNKAYPNGFIYLLETGAIWKQPIMNGEIRVQWSDDFLPENIKGVYPADFFSANLEKRLLVGRFNQLSPDYEDNVIISYGERVEGFDFAVIVQDAEALYQKAEAFSQQSINTISTEKISFGNPFSVEDNGGFTFSQVFTWIYYGIGFLILVLVYLLVRKLRNK